MPSTNLHEYFWAERKPFWKVNGIDSDVLELGETEFKH